MDKIKVMIIDSEEAVKEYKETFDKQEDMELIDCIKSGKDSLSQIKESKPDLVIFDLLEPGIDGFDTVSDIRAELPDCRIIVTSNLNSAVYITKALDLGVDYYMMKPVDVNALVKKGREVCYNTRRVASVQTRRLEEKITNIFITVGIPAHIKGYQFLREAIKMAVYDPHIINSITKKLYPGIAEIYDTTSSKVERAIRHAIEVAWNKGKIENINSVFGLRVYDTHEKPTNGEFIALVADKMLLEKY